MRVLAWLIITTYGSPYITEQARHLRLILLEDAGLADFGAYETRGAMRHGLTACPLCLRIVRYEELHMLVTFNEEIGLVNAAAQVEGATNFDRSELVSTSSPWCTARCSTSRARLAGVMRTATPSSGSDRATRWPPTCRT